MLLVVVRSLGRPGIVLGPFEALLELPVEQLALLALGAELLLEALLPLGGLRAKLVERGAQIVDGPRRGRRLVRDHGSKLRVERELGLAARALDRERRVRHSATLAARPQGRQAVRQCRRWATSPTSFPGPAVGTTRFRNVGAGTSTITTARGVGGTRVPPRTFAACLRNFFRLPLVGAIRKTSPEHWSIEHWSKVFQFEGTPVWMAPDFGFWTDDGRLALVDWKTGGSTPDGAAFQLGCYALYAAEVLGVPPAKVDLFEANLREPEVTQLTWSDERLEAIKEQLRLSVRSMKAYLVDRAATVATT